MKKLISIILLLLFVLPFFCFAELSYDSDDEVMLVGDDFVVAESDFNKEKEVEV